jgi:hypothetical protein
MPDQPASITLRPPAAEPGDVAAGASARTHTATAHTFTHDMTAFVCAVAAIAARRLAEEHQARVELPASSKEDQACR